MKPKLSKYLVAAFLLSLVVHLGVGLGLHIKKYAGQSIVPIGVQISSSGGSTAVEYKKSKIFKKRKFSKTGLISQKHKKTKYLKESPQNLGQTRKGVASGTSGLKSGGDADELHRYQYDFQQFVESRLYYPPAAKKLRQSGQLLMKVELDEEGRIVRVETVKKCPYSRLNEAAVELLSSLGSFKSFPKSYNKKSMVVLLPINYVLQ